MRSTPPDLSQVSRLLVIKMSALGDIAKTIPTVDAIHNAYPHIRIAWVVRKGMSDLLEGNPSIDQLIVTQRGLSAVWRAALDARAWKPEVTLDMQGLFLSGLVARISAAPWRCTWESGRELSGFLTGNPIVRAPSDSNAAICLFNFARIVGVTEMPEDPPAYLVADVDRIVHAEDQLAGVPRPRVGMHIGASVANKTWPPEHFASLADSLMAQGIGVVFFGGPAEAEAESQAVAAMRAHPKSLVGTTTPRELAYAISRCDAFVGCDTGATHIAALTGTPVICLMGATDPVRVGPYGRQHQTIYLGLPCSPCYRRPTCNGRFQCMRNITPECVKAKVIELLQSQKAAI